MHLSDIGEITTGTTPSKDVQDYFGSDYPFYKPSDLDQGINTIKSSDGLTKIGLEQSHKLRVGAVLVTCVGATIGKTGLINEEGASNQQINAIESYKGVEDRYVYYFCISAYAQQSIRDNASATTLPIINKNKFADILMPLPPFEEQKRIIKAIGKWISIVDYIESEGKDIKTLIELTRSKILSLAIQGKLVKQDPYDEPAIELLRRVNKDFRPCDTSHYPYPIPTSWEVVRFQDVLHPMKRAIPCEDYFDYIDIDSIDNKEYKCFPKAIPTNRAPSRASRYTQQGDVLFSMVRPYLRNIAKVEKDGCIASTGFYVCHPRETLNPTYLFFLLISDYVVDGLNSFMKGDNSPSINSRNLEYFEIPLPPLNEQKRIVAKIEELFAMLDAVKEQVTS